MPRNRSLRALLEQPLHEVRAQNIPPEALPLQQLEVPQRRARVREVLDVRRLGPVLEVVEVGDEFGAREVLLRGEVVEVEGVREALDELDTTAG